MRKIIFLDLDGVLNTASWYRQLDSKSRHDEYGTAFDPQSVANLGKVIEATGADIVISSSWKALGLGVMQEMWEVRHLPGKVVGITPTYIDDEMLLNADLSNMDFLNGRGTEIKRWLSKRGKDVSHYVIIDDMDDMLSEQKSHFVQTDPEIGISDMDVDMAILILKNLKYDKKNTGNT